MARERLGEILIRAGLLDEAGLQRALNEQQRWGGQLGRYLVELGLITEEILVRALSTQYKVTAVALDAQRMDIKTGRMIPREICERHNLICFRVDHKQRFLDVAMSDPSNLDAIDEIRVASKYNVRPYIAAPSAIDRAISFVYYGDSTMGGELDLSPESGLRLDTKGSELLERARTRPPSAPAAPASDPASGPPGLEVKIALSPPPAAPKPPTPAAPPVGAAKPAPGPRPAAPAPSAMPAAPAAGARPAAPAPNLRPAAGPATAKPPSPNVVAIPGVGDIELPEDLMLPEEIELPPPTKDQSFHITMDVPAVDKERLARQTFEEQVARIEALVTRDSTILKRLLEALASKGLFTKDEIRRLLGGG